jgi:hypothetical protein
MKDNKDSIRIKSFCSTIIKIGENLWDICRRNLVNFHSFLNLQKVGYFKTPRIILLK